MTPPLPAPPPASSNRIILTRSATYAGLHFGHKDVVDTDVEIPPAGAPSPWRLRITRPGGGNLGGDPPELQDLMLVLSYAWT